MPHGQLEFLSEPEKKNRGPGEGCCFPELTELSKPGTAVSCLSQGLLLPYPPSSRGEKDAVRGAGGLQVMGPHGARAMAPGQQVAWAHLCHHPSLKTSGEGGLAHLQWHLPAASVGREQVLLLPGQSPGRTTRHACTQPPVTSPVWESSRCPHPTGQEKYSAQQPIREDFILLGLKGPEGGGNSQGQLSLMWIPR